MPDASQLATYARLLRLTPVGDEPLRPELATPVETTEKPAARRWPVGLIPFLLLVLLPTCLTAGYFCFLAADRFESEARFILRTPGNTAPAAAASKLMQTAGAAAGASQASDDGYAVQEFLESRDALQILAKTANFRGALEAAKRDPLWSFPNFFTSNSEEGLFAYYKRLLLAKFDDSTGVSTLRIEAFRPEDANRFATVLLDSAEALVNRLSERARHDAISLAQSEAESMRQRTLKAQAELTAFRERERLIDPSQATFAILETIARLSVDAADLSVQLNELAKGSPRAPQAAALRNRRAALENQIANERKRLAGDSRSIAPRIAEYERLMLEREFAERALMSAMTAVEMARVEAQRQRVYLERVTEPSRPDYPAYPLGVLWTLAVFAAGYMTYRVWCILAADVRRHAEP